MKIEERLPGLLFLYVPGGRHLFIWNEAFFAKIWLEKKHGVVEF